MAPSDQILHVSDTALMAAACRATETDRPDGLIRDPFAKRLAGDRGMAIARAIPGSDFLNFGIAVRTRFLDDLISETITQVGITCVLSAGSGLDTRPWRLNRPSTLRWIEVDFPAMLDHTAAEMATERPSCFLQCVPADLDQPADRSSAAAVGEGPGLLITEGLLMFVSAATVEAWAAEAASSGIRYWLMDASAMDFARRAGMDPLGTIHNVRAAGHLEATEILDVVRRHGWTQLRHRSYARDSREVAQERIESTIRALIASGTAVPTPSPDDPSGVYLFGRS